MLALRSLFFTLVVPGTVAGLIPYLILSRRHVGMVQPWTEVQYLSLIPILAGAGILLWCIRDFMVRGRGTLAPVDPPKQLVVQGLYRYVRNPMYLGVLILLLGEAAFFQSLALLQYTVAWFIVVNLVVVLYEEPSLRRRFGEAYERYSRSVHRWVPTQASQPDGLMVNGKMPLLLTLLAAGVFVATLLIAQPYSADWPGRAFAKPAKQYVQAALRQDSLELAQLSVSDAPVHWALDAARTHRQSLANWTGRTQALTGARWGDTTEVFLYPSGDACSEAPIHFRFLGSGRNARVLSASSTCLTR